MLQTNLEAGASIGRTRLTRALTFGIRKDSTHGINIKNTHNCSLKIPWVGHPLYREGTYDPNLKTLITLKHYRDLEHFFHAYRMWHCKPPGQNFINHGR